MVPALELLAQRGRQRDKCVKNFGHTADSMTNPEGRETHPESHREELLFAWVLRDAWECVCGQTGRMVSQAEGAPGACLACECVGCLRVPLRDWYGGCWLGGKWLERPVGSGRNLFWRLQAVTMGLKGRDGQVDCPSRVSTGEQSRGRG